MNELAGSGHRFCMAEPIENNLAIIVIFVYTIASVHERRKICLKM
jgi:hypothetical protein